MTFDLAAIEGRANTPIECSECSLPATHEWFDGFETDYLLCESHAEGHDSAEPLMDGQTQERADRLWLVARVRELESERTIALDAFHRCRVERDDWRVRARDMEAEAQSEAVGHHAYKQEAAELLATLANERGEGEGPSAGWVWEDGHHAAACWRNGHSYVRRNRGPIHAWVWYADVGSDDDTEDVEGDVVTAREGMQAVDRVRRST